MSDILLHSCTTTEIYTIQLSTLCIVPVAPYARSPVIAPLYLFVHDSLVSSNAIFCGPHRQRCVFAIRRSLMVAWQWRPTMVLRSSCGCDRPVLNSGRIARTQPRKLQSSRPSYSDRRTSGRNPRSWLRHHSPSRTLVPVWLEHAHILSLSCFNIPYIVHIGFRSTKTARFSIRMG